MICTVLPGYIIAVVRRQFIVKLYAVPVSYLVAVYCVLLSTAYSRLSVVLLGSLSTVDSAALRGRLDIRYMHRARSSLHRGPSSLVTSPKNAAKNKSLSDEATPHSLWINCCEPLYRNTADVGDGYVHIEAHLQA